MPPGPAGRTLPDKGPRQLDQTGQPDPLFLLFGDHPGRPEPLGNAGQVGLALVENGVPAPAAARSTTRPTRPAAPGSPAAPATRAPRPGPETAPDWARTGPRRPGPVGRPRPGAARPRRRPSRSPRTRASRHRTVRPPGGCNGSTGRDDTRRAPRLAGRRTVRPRQPRSRGEPRQARCSTTHLAPAPTRRIAHSGKDHQEQPYTVVDGCPRPREQEQHEQQ